MNTAREAVTATSKVTITPNTKIAGNVIIPRWDAGRTNNGLF